MADTASTASTPAPGNRIAGFGDLKESLDDIRANLRRWTAGVGAVATAVLAGVGWTQADRLFPLPGPSWVPWLAGVSSGAALVAAVYILVSLFAAQTRIHMGNEDELTRYKIYRSDSAWPKWLRLLQWRKWREKQLVERALADLAAAEEAPKLVDVDRRAQRLVRIASRLELREPDTRLAKAARKEADRLSEYVELAKLRVVLMLLERRARRVTRIWSLTALALLIAALGIAGLYTAANYSKGERDRAKVVARCADVLKGTRQASKCPKIVTP